PGYSRDGTSVVYGRNGFHWTRPRYVGSSAAQIWLLDLQDGSRHSLTHDFHQHLWTRFMPDGKNLLTVTIGEETPSVSRLDDCISKVVDSPQRTPNHWLLDFEWHSRQLTFFT